MSSSNKKASSVDKDVPMKDAEDVPASAIAAQPGANGSAASSSTASSSAATSTESATAAASKRKKKNNKKRGKKSAAGADDDSDAMETNESDEARKWLDGLSAESLLNAQLLQQSHLQQLSDSFHSATPFKHLVLKSILDDDFLRHLEGELRGLDYRAKSNDLFEFAQSNDLKAVHTPLIEKLKQVLYGSTFRGILKSITGIDTTPLESAVSISSNVYGTGNHLLCHDDELYGRRIAFILYLVPKDWSGKDGGALDLFSVDSTLQPDAIVKSLVPQWNSLTFFEVSPVSYHQVAEVLTTAVDPTTGENRVRLSISGWFHGAPISRPPPAIDAAAVCAPLLQLPASEEEKQLQRWISPDYLKPKTISAVRAQFEQESSIELVSFLSKKTYDSVYAALTAAAKEEWHRQGPANKRWYWRLKDTADDGASASAATAAASSLSSSSASSSVALLHSLHAFFRSSVFASYLNSITGLNFLAATGQVRQFSPGCYTLAHSEDEERYEEAVDINFCAILQPPAGIAGKKKRWNVDSHGGGVHYIEEGVEEELMSIDPRANCLSIVFRTGVPVEEREEARKKGERGVIKFIKYVNHQAPAPRFDFDYIFRIEPVEGGDDDDEEEEAEEEGEAE